MESKIMQVFYGEDCLPYKDKERTVHYPIVGNSFIGASNVNQIRFYVRDIGGTASVSWVAITKLPNGQIGNEVLSSFGYDADINEYYVSLNLSSFYTSLKGDIYISLNGYQGEIQVEEDQETGISTIVGTPTIQATGSVKISINYAPHLPLGQHFNIDDLQQILALISEKANIPNTIQVIADITQEDLTSYVIGQLFFDLQTKSVYEKTADDEYEFHQYAGVLTKDKELVRIDVSGANDKQIDYILDNLFEKQMFIANDGSRDYLCYLVKMLVIPGSPQTYRACAILINNNGELSYYEKVVSEEDYLRVDFLASNETTKNTFVKKISQGNIVYATNILGDNIAIGYGVSATGSAIAQRDTNGQLNVPLEPTSNSHATSKKYVDESIATIKRNSFINVDTEEYPTLDSFRASTGEEGYIYLYPIDSSDLTKGYYQYIWEEEGWEDLGTTQIDLSDYYTKEETNDIADDIKANVPKYQVETIFIVDPLTNINGRAFQNYTSTNVQIGDYTGVKILRGGISLNETYAKEYMEYMTGSYYLPKYNYDKPKNTYFITPTGHVYKPQFDNTNGLVLYDFGDLSTKAYADTKVSKISQSNKIYGTDNSGNQKTFDVDNTVGADGNIVRRASGTSQIMVPLTPTANGHASSKKYVDDTVANAVASVYRIKGSKTVAEINALTGQQVGDVYNVTDSGTIVLGDLQVFTGDNIVWTGSAWDKLGAEIDWSAYDEKFIAAGFFEVEDYDDDTGEISLVYATELYDMSYNSDTGVMTIEAN